MKLMTGWGRTVILTSECIKETAPTEKPHIDNFSSNYN